MSQVYTIPASTVTCLQDAAADMHDHLMVKLESPELEAMGAQSGNAIRLRIDLASWNGFTDYRIVTQDRRRHQFLVPLFGRLPAEEVAIKLTINGDDGCHLPEFNVSTQTCNKNNVLQALEQKMIWVFGSARTGSTWVTRDILGHLPSKTRLEDKTGFRPMDENGVGQILGTFNLYPETLYALDSFVGHEDHGYDFETIAGSRALIKNPIFERIIFKRFGENEFFFSDHNDESVIRIIRDIVFQQVMMQWGVMDYDFVVFKSPNDSHAADILMKALPDSRMIFLMRDGRDVLRSRFSPFASRDLAETNDIAMRRFAVSYYAHYWNFQTDIVSAAYTAHDPDRRLFLKYEDLRREAPEAFRSLLTFVGFDANDEIIGDLMTATRLENIPESERGSDLPRQQGKIGGFQDQFSAKEITLMTGIMRDNLKRYGYNERGISGKSDISEGANDISLYDLLSIMPEGTVTTYYAGIYNDNWISNDSEIDFLVPENVRSICIFGILPITEDSKLDGRQIYGSLNSNKYYFNFVESGDCSFSIIADIPAYHPIKLTIRCSDVTMPNEDAADQRRLGFRLNGISVT